MRLFLGRERSGLYMLTSRPPVTESDGIGRRNLYVAPGDDIGIRHLCAAGVLELFGCTLRPLEYRLVNVEATLVDLTGE